MAAIGTDTVTSVSRRFILPELTDNIYDSNPVFFRLNKSRRKIVQGGTQIEVPLMYAELSAGGAYSGYDVLTIAPSDTVKNAVFDWKQHYVPVVVDGLTLIKTDSPESIVNFLQMSFAQAEMQMAENLGTGLWSDGTTNSKEITGLGALVDDGGVAASYGGITRSSNTWWKAVDDASTGTLTLAALQAAFGSATTGGKHPTLLVSRQEQYNRYYALAIASQEFPVAAGGHDEQLASAGFTNLLFNNTPWVVDSHCFDGPNTSNSAIVGLNEDFIHWVVSPRADFVLEPFQTPTNQDAMVAKLLFAGNLAGTNCAAHFKLSNISA